MSAGKYITIGSHSRTVKHNADGSCPSIKLSASLNLSGTTLGTGTVSVSVKPDTIPRESKVSLSSTNFIVGNSITINTNRASSSFTHTAVIKCGSFSKTITKIGASTTWNTTELYQYMTTSVKASGYVQLTTYNGSTKIGTVTTVNFTANITNSNPTLNSYKYEDINENTIALTGDNSVLINGFSNVKIHTLTYTLKNSARFSRIQAKIGSKGANTTDASPGANMVIKAVNTPAGILTIYDSRGLTGTCPFRVASAKWIYNKIKISNMTVERVSGHQGTEDMSGTATMLSLEGTWWNDNFGTKANSIKTVQYFYKKTDETAWTVGDATELSNNLNIDGNKFSISELDIKGDIQQDSADSEGNITYYGFKRENAYQVKIIISDEIASAEYTVNLPIGKPYIKFGDQYCKPQILLVSENDNLALIHDNGKSIGFGVGSGQVNRGIYDNSDNFWILFRDANHTYLNSNEHNIYFRPNNNGTNLSYQASDGTWHMGGTILPSSNLSYNLGTPSYAFSRLYVNNIYAKGMAADVISGSDGSNLYIGTGSGQSKKTTNIRGNTVRLYAHTSGAVYLGYSGSTAVTSDENLKNIYDLDDKYLDFFMNLKPISYVYKDNGHRNHLGFGARQVEQALLDADLTTEDFAGVLIDKDVTIGADEAGTKEDVHYDELYSLRYEEFVALNTAMIQKQAEIIEQQQKEIDELKERVSKLEKENC